MYKTNEQVSFVSYITIATCNYEGELTLTTPISSIISKNPRGKSLKLFFKTRWLVFFDFKYYRYIPSVSQNSTFQVRVRTKCKRHGHGTVMIQHLTDADDGLVQMGSGVIPTTAGPTSATIMA